MASQLSHLSSICGMSLPGALALRSPAPLSPSVGSTLSRVRSLSGSFHLMGHTHTQVSNLSQCLIHSFHSKPSLCMRACPQSLCIPSHVYPCLHWLRADLHFSSLSLPFACEAPSSLHLSIKHHHANSPVFGIFSMFTG